MHACPALSPQPGAPSPASAPVLVGPCSAHPPPLQIISQGQAKAESITLDLGVHIKHKLLTELAAFLRRWVCVLACTEGALQPPSLCPRWGSNADQCPLPAPRVSVPTGH